MFNHDFFKSDIPGSVAFRMLPRIDHRGGLFGFDEGRAGDATAFAEVVPKVHRRVDAPATEPRRAAARRARTCARTHTRTRAAAAAT